MADSSPLPAESGLVLIGYRASGKTTVGRHLAEKLGRSFIDLDAEIERRAGRTIADIFEDEGEPAFRSLEERVLREVCREHPGVVVATGGGAILRESNRCELAKFGIIVWLSAPAEVLVRRLRLDAQQRPALTAAGLVDEVPQILKEREPSYRELADVIVDCSARSPEDVAELVVRMLRSPELALKERR
ncbi:MAG: aroK [Planctomycetota bacterium]|nr:aroK [Planctomycetota bacterium]